MRRAILALVIVAGLSSQIYGQVDIEQLKEKYYRSEERLAALQRGETKIDRLRAEQATWAALERPARSFEFFEAPLTEVVNRIAEDHELRILLDEAALSEREIGTDTLITKIFKGVPLKAALDAMVKDHRLGWVVADECVVITTKERAANYLFQRIYSVRDLATYRDEQGTHADYAELVALVRTTIEPDGWRVPNQDEYEQSELGTIGANAATGTLVVVQNRKNHEDIEALFDLLREARAKQEAGNKEAAGAKTPKPLPAKKTGE